MATHDYVIDNQSASAFRSDLNSVLQAIVTQNSNATAPTTTYANMFWYDTAANQLKKRNEADSAWVILGTIDEALGTFTPTGQRALSSQAQAEAGTDNTTVMTPLRTAQAIAALAPAPTTAEILAANAAAAAGAVGTYGFFRTSNTADLAFGATVAGSTLVPAGLDDSDNTQASGAARSGTWRCMGYSNYTAGTRGGAGRLGITVFLRTA